MLVAMVLLGSTAFSMVMWIRAVGATSGMKLALLGEAEQRKQSERSRDEARKSAAIAEAISQFQSDMLASADPYHRLGDTVTVVEATLAAVKELDGGKLRDQPLV